MGGDDGSTAAAEGVQHQAAFGASRGDELFQQGDGFLGLIAQVFAPAGAEVGEPGRGQDEVLGPAAGVGGGVALQAGPDAALAGVVNQTGGVQGVQPPVQIGDVPVAGDEVVLNILGVGAGEGHRPMAVARGDIVVPPGLPR